MIAFGKSPRSPIEPSTTMTMGATARIGTICEQMIHGSRLFSRRAGMNDQDGEHDAETTRRAGSRRKVAESVTQL